MNHYSFIKVIIINLLMKADGLTGYDIIKFCRSSGIPASSGTVYPHLRALMETGYIACTEEGRRKVYRMTQDGREALKVSGLAKSPDFLMNAYYKSIMLAANMDWMKRGDVQILIDNVEEIKKYLIDYMEQL